MKWKPDWFLTGMVVATALAWLWPEPGARGGWLQPELLTKAGVALVFFLNGLAIPFTALKAGTLRWPLHLVVQGCTFLLFPLLGLALLALGGSWLPPDLALGFFFLCALPSTVSSSVALTAAARGNVPAAVFNAALSSLLGVVLTPLWLSLKLHAAGQAPALGGVILDLCLWLVLPLALGQLCRPWMGRWLVKHPAFGKRLSLVDRCTILLLIYTSFCDSVQQKVWSGHGWSGLLLVFLGSGLVFAVTMLALRTVCSALDFSREDRIAAMFCGSKKTLASGVPMAHLIFGAHPGLGLILLPIMIYHPLQLVICSVLAGRWAREPAPVATGGRRV